MIGGELTSPLILLYRGVKQHLIISGKCCCNEEPQYRFLKEEHYYTVISYQTLFNKKMTPPPNRIVSLRQNEVALEQGSYIRGQNMRFYPKRKYHQNPS